MSRYASLDFGNSQQLQPFPLINSPRMGRVQAFVNGLNHFYLYMRNNKEGGIYTALGVDQ
jgi:hypothetical protein